MVMLEGKAWIRGYSSSERPILEIMQDGVLFQFAQSVGAIVYKSTGLEQQSYLLLMHFFCYLHACRESLSMVSTMGVGPTPGLMAPATREGLVTTSEPLSLSCQPTHGGI